MRHRVASRKLGRERHNRIRLMRTLSHEVLRHESIVTTEARAKELRRFLEPLVKTAGGDLSLHRRRNLIKKINSMNIMEELIQIGKKSYERKGGYLRLTKMPDKRSDGARLIKVEIIDT